MAGWGTVNALTHPIEQIVRQRKIPKDFIVAENLGRDRFQMRFSNKCDCLFGGRSVLLLFVVSRMIDAFGANYCILSSFTRISDAFWVFCRMMDSRDSSGMSPTNDQIKWMVNFRLCYKPIFVYSIQYYRSINGKPVTKHGICSHESVLWNSVVAILHFNAIKDVAPRIEIGRTSSRQDCRWHTYLLLGTIRARIHWWKHQLRKHSRQGP